MASIKKDKNGKWLARISVKHPDGSFHTKSKRFRTKKEAELFASSLEVKKEDGILKESHDEIFSEYFKFWYDTYRKPKITEVTEGTYNHVLSVIKRYFTNVSIKKITRASYQRFITEYGKEHAPVTVRKVNGIIRACVKNAIYDDILKKDFTYNITFVANKDKEFNVENLSILEIKELINYVYNHLSPDKISYYMIFTALLTGARLSEIAGLTWKDVNFNFKTITINKTYDYRHPGRFKKTKTTSSNRTIKINDALLNVLKTFKNKRNGKDNDLVFINFTNKLVPSSNAVNKSLRYCLKQLGLQKNDFHFHSLRHAHVAYLLAQGVDIYAISKRLGHSNISITMEVYAYLIDEAKDKNDQKIVDSLDNLFDEKNKKKTAL